MLKVVSVNLGSPTRNKKVETVINDQPISITRIGTGRDEKFARRLFRELDGTVDVLTVGGMDLAIHIEDRVYPTHPRSYCPFFVYVSLLRHKKTFLQ